jgi:O-antigen/teichoic acid export membrane protein
VSRAVDKTKALGKTAQRGVAWSFVRESVSELLVFPASMVLARMLTPEEFGVAAAAGFFILLAGRLSELGFNAALVRAKEVEPVHYSTVFVAQLVIGVATFLIMVALAPLIGRFYEIPSPGLVIPVAAVGFLITPFGTVPSAILQRNFEFKKTATVDWVQLLALSVANLVFAMLGFSYMSLVYGRLVQLLTAAVLRIYFARWKPSLQFSFPAFRQILPSGAGFFTKRLLDYSAQNGDNLVVGKVLGLGALGLYDKAYSTMNRFLGRMNTGGPGVMFRIFAAIHEEPERFRRAYQKVMMSSSMLGFPVFSALGVMAPQLMVVMFGPQWLPAAGPFALLCATGAFKLLNSYASSATQAAGHIWSEVWRQVLYISLIVGGIIVASPWGPTGAAAGVLAATAIMSVLMHILLHRVTHQGFVQLVKPLGPAVACSAGVIAVVLAVEYGLRAAIGTPNPWLLVACQLPVAALFVLGFVLFAPHRELRSLVVEISGTVVPKSIRKQRWARAYLNAQSGAVREAGSGY